MSTIRRECELRARRRQTAIASRKKYLPKQLEATRRKLKGLIAEAKRYGMIELLTYSELGEDK